MPAPPPPRTSQAELIRSNRRSTAARRARAAVGTSTMAGDQEPAPSRAQVADVDGHLRRVRTWNEIRRAEEIEESLPRQPLPPPDDLVLHHRDVRRGPTEGDAAELQEEPGKLAQAHSPRLRRGIGVRCHRAWHS